MDSRNFDRLTRTLARPTSRRRAIRGLGGLGAASIAVGGADRPVTAQEATPSPRSDTDVEFMFVQIAKAGSWRPKPGEPGVYLLTLDEVAEETVYFSDRPDRIVGTVETQTFLDGLGFTPTDPPNAALVVQTETGQDILVIELLNPSYEPLTEQLTYEARVLPTGEAGEALDHLATRQADAELPETFGAASLFIDDCPDANPLDCYMLCKSDNVNLLGDLGRRGMCWHWDTFDCRPCDGDWDGTARECNDKYPTGCWGECFTDRRGCFIPA